MKQTVAITTERPVRRLPAPRRLAFNQIVVPTDCSQRSKAAVDYAVELARRLGAQVTLLHVVPDPTPFDYSLGGVPDGQWEQIREDADKRLGEELARTKCSYQRVDSLVRTGTGLHEQIVSAVREVSADLVVLSTHGYRGWKHFFLGSDAEQLLHEVSCPVLVVRSQ
jgi:nucleotide-binding universal stress UspA family protein